jgi:RNA polymerase sigma-70 factor (ECF subfamily)
MPMNAPTRNVVARLPGSAEEDAMLLRQLQSGDEAAYERLVRHNGSAMLALARRFVRHDETARDIVQEAFISAFRAVPTFRGDSSLSTWLHRIVVNAALMHLRRSKRRPETLSADLLPQFDDTDHHVTTFEPVTRSVESQLLQRETRAHVRACIDRLPNGHRTVLILRDIEERSTADTAEMLGISANAVKIRLHRARQALTTLLNTTP